MASCHDEPQDMLGSWKAVVKQTSNSASWKYSEHTGEPLGCQKHEASHSDGEHAPHWTWPKNEAQIAKRKQGTHPMDEVLNCQQCRLCRAQDGCYPGGSRDGCQPASPVSPSGYSGNIWKLSTFRSQIQIVRSSNQHHFFTFFTASNSSWCMGSMFPWFLKSHLVLDPTTVAVNPNFSWVTQVGKLKFLTFSILIS